MAVLAQVPSNTYAAGTRTVNFTAPSARMNIRVTLTRESWPSGGTLSYDVKWAGIVGGGVSGLSTGPLLDRNGNEYSTLVMEMSKDAGRTDGVLTVTNSVTLTTAITVESV